MAASAPAVKAHIPDPIVAPDPLGDLDPVVRKQLDDLNAKIAEMQKDIDDKQNVLDQMHTDPNRPYSYTKIGNDDQDRERAKRRGEKYTGREEQKAASARAEKVRILNEMVADRQMVMNAAMLNQSANQLAQMTAGAEEVPG